MADIHLGRSSQDIHAREKAFADWLDSIASDAAALYLLGDIFDFWWEYKYVVPKGYVRVLGKLARLVDSGVSVHFFKGNHDQWTYGYLENEVGLQVHDKPLVMQIGRGRFCLGHEHRQNSGLFGSRFLQRCFGSVHPRWGMSIGYTWSANHRMRSVAPDGAQEGVESLCRFAATFPRPVDYFVFGHLHTPFNAILANGVRIIVLGAWMDGGEYGVFDEQADVFELKSAYYGT
ncbi:MAG: UDP-2,3-diacylglucosamine diphosphatase [Bacteroidetes bacterium]|nr:UDP-2,3-diacylglucosamine diphosphatase [Bacteroidota bacterium]